MSMTFAELMNALTGRVVRLQRDGADLVVLSEEDTLTPSLLNGLSEHKAELLDLIDRNGGDWLSPAFTITPEMLPLAQLNAAEIERIVSCVPGGAANIQDIYPLAPLQEGILFHHLMESEGDVYLTSALLSFDSRERVEKFVRALQAVISRHDILRTAVVWEGLPEPAQVVWREAPLSVEEVSTGSEGGRDRPAVAGAFRSPALPFGCATGPADARLHGLRRGRRTLAAAVAEPSPDDRPYHAGDHDAGGAGASVRRGRAVARAAAVPELRGAGEAWAGGIGREEHEAFFREMLGDVDEPTAPFGLTDAQGDGSGIEEARLELEMGLSRRLRERARMLGVSAASLCHLAWALVLARVSGRDDVVFGTVLFGRMQGGEGADRALGLFINTLPIRIRVDEEGVERSAKRAHRLLAELIAHEHASLALAQRLSGVEAPAPLFSSLLNYRHSPRGTEAAEAETAAGVDRGQKSWAPRSGPTIRWRCR